MANAEGERPNPLFVPDCTCPACLEREVARLAEAADWAPSVWLRASGRRQRQRVETVTLSELGRRLLG